MQKKNKKQRLHAGLFGELRVLSTDVEVDLPASKKTRALLGYLLASENRRTRGELCDMFWENAEDPRAALRWSLSKLRTTMGPDVVLADRNSVDLDRQVVNADTALVEAAISTIATTSFAKLSTLESLFRGEFLNGLEMPGCYRFYEWCQAERSRFGQMHEQLLLTLFTKTRHEPDRALEFAHKLVAKNPFEESGHVRIIELLSSMGRHADAHEQARQCRSVFSTELDVEPTAALDRALAQIGKSAPKKNKAPSLSTRQKHFATDTVPQPIRLVGRETELDLIEKAFCKSASEIVLIVGVPGIGKSTLLDTVKSAYGDRVLSARAYEAEQTRPYGVWLDALRTLDLTQGPNEATQSLNNLLSGRRDGMVSATENEVFDAVVSMLANLAASGPVLVTMDDLQWTEPSSCALLSYAIRNLEGTEVYFCLAARAGEIDDNDAAQALLDSFGKRLLRIALSGLSEQAAQTLLKSVHGYANAKDFISKANGNPLYLLALASNDNVGQSNKTLRDILTTRITRLSQAAINLLSWASVFGQIIPMETLIEVSGIEFADALTILDELERHNVLQFATSDASEFSHDLIREAAYGRLSNIRRKLMHGKIADHLSKEMQTRPDVAIVVLHHSNMSDKHLTAARAAAMAGERAMTVYANSEAIELAKQGLTQTKQLEGGGEKISLTIQLLGIQVLAASGPFLTHLPKLAPDISSEILRASQHAMATDVAHGEYLLSVLYQEMGDHEASQQATARAAEAAARMDVRKKVRQLANSARCLLELGRNIPKAKMLAEDAEALAKQEGIDDIEVYWSKGLLANWDGDLVAAASFVDSALELAQQSEDRWRECKCLIWASTISLESGLPERAINSAAQLNAIAEKIGEGSSAPFAQAIVALAQKNDDHLDAAINALKTADDKSLLAYVLNLAADQQTKKNNPKEAVKFAREAYDIARQINNQNETVYSQAIAFTHGVELGDVNVLSILNTNVENQFMARVRNIAALALRPSNGKLP